jgi:hypothetical protein
VGKLKIDTVAKIKASFFDFASDVKKWMESDRDIKKFF